MNNGPEVIERRILSVLGSAGFPRVTAIRKLAGDASNRSYYRCFVDGDRSYIAMVNAASDRAIVSEEIAAHSRGFEEMPFINIHRYLTQLGIRVPAIHYNDREEGILILDDLGDTLLGDIINRSGQSEELYEQAIDMMIRLQTREEHIPRWCYARLNRFDSRLYDFEFDHFVEYGIVKAGVELPHNVLSKLQKLFHRLSVLFERYSTVFVHRDYHSRNLLHFKGQLYTIDFQDALVGAPHYDLASLLRDAYVDLTDDFVERMVDHYLSGSPYASAGFKDIFTLLSIQRMLKAAGRFRYIKLVKGNDKFMRYVPGLLQRVKRLSLSYSSDPPLDIIAEAVDRIEGG
ncbi:MAG: phosphotransferase [Deltaproteobacteria bacterium]|nr:phosphotransferase [Deltaproteobacteria bacterium]MCL5277902.1 phosphotransferase [Deltaproteobacteria bacterium]